MRPTRRDEGPVSVTIEEMEETINEIGLARFVGRINSGVVPAEKGFVAVDRFVTAEQERPLLSKVSRAVFKRPNSYDKV